MEFLIFLTLFLASSYAALPEKEMLSKQIEINQQQIQMQDSWLSNVSLFGDVYTGTRHDSSYIENNGYWQSTLGLDWNLGSNSAEKRTDKNIKRIKLMYDMEKLDSLKSYEILQKWRLTRRVKHYENFLANSNTALCTDSLSNKKLFDFIELQSACYSIERYKIQANLVIWQSRDSLFILKDVESDLDTTTDIIDVSKIYKNRYRDSLVTLVGQTIKNVNGFEYDLGIRVGKNFGGNNVVRQDEYIGMYFSVPLSSFFGISNKKIEYMSYLKLQDYKLRLGQNVNNINRTEKDLDGLRTQLQKLNAQIKLQEDLIKALEFRVKNSIENDYDKLLRATVDLAVLQFQSVSILDIQNELVLKLMYVQGDKK